MSEWARVRELAAAGVSERKIAQRLGMNRRTVARLAQAEEPPRYRRQPTGSALDAYVPLIEQVLGEWPEIHAPRRTEILRGHGYRGSERVVRRRLAELRPRPVRAAQRTGYAPGQVAQVGKTHLAIALAVKAAQAGHRVAFATAADWVARLEAAQERNSLEQELRRLERCGVLVIDEVGYLPLERQAANLLFALVARRYERGSLIITSSRSFEQWGEILGDAMVAAALIDRLVHHATMINLKGKSYRLRERGQGVVPAAQIPAPPRARRRSG